ncbi:flagellar hook-length control protein FliK [Denitromonas iodatirespirans]|uniref:Flagellar hook-length control protein FliK n=1 Tax=Denitromonas iodatirespirans TaxID=2795389 RepID=A0A944DE11_DENI1|nr:flagellar hook-length control protein FliK [Denitromonas iodatirespirans]MBT0963336.1 flagellar hook-length control protein FliK [Denitromonas iodatirespirans]
MAQSPLTQLLSAAAPRGSAARERHAADNGAQPDVFSRTLDQKMNAPERPAERPVERSAERRPERPAERCHPAQSQAQPPARAPQAPAKPAAPAESRRPEATDTTAKSPAQAPADAASDTSASDATTGTAPQTTATAAADAQAMDAEATLATDTTADPAAALAGTPAALAGTPAALAAATASPAAAPVTLPGATTAPTTESGPLRQTSAEGLALAAGKGQPGAAATGREPATGLTAPAADDAAPVTVAKARPTNFAELLAANTAARGERGTPLSGDTPALPGQAGAPGLNTAMAGLHAPATDRPQASQAALPIHVNTPASEATWGDAVGNRVLWLAGRNESKAELILTPPHLGKLEISLTVSGDTTTAQFTAATPAAREALEQAMPRLREMLEQAGVMLADSNVNTAPQDNRGDTGQGFRHSGGRISADNPQEAVMSRSGPWLQRGTGLIDTFA